jgi:hypothetical protein
MGNTCGMLSYNNLPQKFPERESRSVHYVGRLRYMGNTHGKVSDDNLP